MGAEASLLSSCSTDCSPILSTPDWSLHHAQQQEELAICLGLLEVIQALCFLHTTACVSHNNISQAAVFVTPDGRWKLGGLELVSKGAEESRAKDIQALGLLVTEVLASCSTATSMQFRDFAKNQMLLPDVARLPSLNTVLENEYFNLPFPSIVQFLKSLPLQSQESKVQFFTSLHEKLRILPSSVVALQLLPLLLSRYVFMDPTARACLLPHLLVPQSSTTPPPSTSPLLPLPKYLAHLVPHLKLLFS